MDTEEMNLRALEAASSYLHGDARFITLADVKAIMDCGVEEKTAVLELFLAACGLDTESDPAARILRDRYFAPTLRRLDPAVLREDPYMKTIHFPQTAKNGWQMTSLYFAPYELFVRDDLLILPDGREIPQLGYYDESVIHPSVLQDGREWMTVTPEEIATVGPGVEAAFGKTLTFGLGLGYFAFGASEKENVSSVTVVERDPDVISLFEEFILPQFPHRDKICIVKDDAFRYAKDILPGEKMDYVYADIWHDTLDGAPMYKHFKELEPLTPGTKWDYWIETSIRSFLRATED